MDVPSLEATPMQLSLTCNIAKDCFFFNSSSSATYKGHFLMATHANWNNSILSNGQDHVGTFYFYKKTIFKLKPKLLNSILLNLKLKIS